MGSRLAFFFPAILVLCRVSAAGDSQRVEFDGVVQSLVEERLHMVKRNVADREATLVHLFEDAGCGGERLSRQPVPHSKQRNIVCTMPGGEAGTILAGGHFDFVDRGIGAVDDWSGAALLPSLYQSLKTKPRRHTFVFAGFAAEEVGLRGSAEYVRKLSGHDKQSTHAMINLECLGLSPPKVWAHRADKKLLEDYLRVARALNLQLAASNVEKVGDDDSHPFINAGIPSLTIHSITQETWGILHSPRDNLDAIHMDDYYAAYRLAATFLAYLDSALD